MRETVVQSAMHLQRRPYTRESFLDTIDQCSSNPLTIISHHKGNPHHPLWPAPLPLLQRWPETLRGG